MKKFFSAHPVLCHRGPAIAIAAILFLISAPLLGETAPGRLLYLPREDGLFTLFSPVGDVSVIGPTALWPASMRIRTPGNGMNVQALSSGLPAFSIRSVDISFWLMVDGIDNLNELWLFVSDDRSFGNRLVFFVSDYSAEIGEKSWVKIRLPLEAAEITGTPDIEHLNTIQFRVNDNGAGSVSVFVGPAFLEPRIAGRENSILSVVPAAGTDTSIPDWNAATALQPPVIPDSADDGQVSSPEIENRQLHGGMNAVHEGTPQKSESLSIDFSLDWRMVLGRRASDASAEGDPQKGDWQYYNQVDDLYAYVQKPLSATARLSAAAGVEAVNFSDFSEGSIGGSDFHLKRLLLEQEFGKDVTFQAGYHVPDPVYKWMQVTRSATVESSFGQDMAPLSLWIGAKWKFAGHYGVQAAVNPDVIGRDNAAGLRALTYQQDLGVPVAFGSVWYESDRLEGEAALCVNGDAVKVAAGISGHQQALGLRFFDSLGYKYTSGKDFSTYPEWDHIDGAHRISGGISAAVPVKTGVIRSGLSCQVVVYPDNSTRLFFGIDSGIGFGNAEVFGLLTSYDAETFDWGETIGFEGGVSYKIGGVTYMAGYTMAGFNVVSGLYNNKVWNEGGVDGVFLRIKATYW